MVLDNCENVLTLLAAILGLLGCLFKYIKAPKRGYVFLIIFFLSTFLSDYYWTIYSLVMDTYPEIKERFYLVILKRIESQDLSIMILSQKTVRQKISYYLLSLSREQKSEQVALPVSKEVIAKLLAIPRQSFSRELSRMESEGRIKVEGRTIGIIDLPSLEREIGVV